MYFRLLYESAGSRKPLFSGTYNRNNFDQIVRSGKLRGGAYLTAKLADALLFGAGLGQGYEQSGQRQFRQLSDPDQNAYVVEIETDQAGYDEEALDQIVHNPEVILDYFKEELSPTDYDRLRQTFEAYDKSLEEDDRDWYGRWRKITYKLAKQLVVNPSISQATRFQLFHDVPLRGAYIFTPNQKVKHESHSRGEYTCTKVVIPGSIKLGTKSNLGEDMYN